jgi:hypothetical protein
MREQLRVVRSALAQRAGSVRRFGGRGGTHPSRIACKNGRVRLNRSRPLEFKINALDLFITSAKHDSAES